MANKYNLKDKKIAKTPFWSLSFAIKSVFLFGGVPIILVLLIFVPAQYLPEYKIILRNNISLTSVLIFGAVYFSFFVAYMAAKLKQRPHCLTDLGLRTFPIGTTIKYIALYPLVYLAIVISMVSIIVAIANLLGFSLSPDDIAPNQNKRSYSLLVVPFVVLAIPILEEILFRGILLPAFARKSGWLKGSIYTSLIFSMLHGPAAPLIMIFSLYLSRMYYRTGSIVPGILLHMANNAFVCFVIFQR